MLIVLNSIVSGKVRVNVKVIHTTMSRTVRFTTFPPQSSVIIPMSTYAGFLDFLGYYLCNFLAIIGNNLSILGKLKMCQNKTIGLIQLLYGIIENHQSLSMIHNIALTIFSLLKTDVCLNNWIYLLLVC